MYSASVELCATEDYFRLNQDIIVEPNVKQHPEVLLQFSEFPAQSESVYPFKFNLVLEYFRPYPIVPLRYLRMCYAATK